VSISSKIAKGTFFLTLSNAVMQVIGFFSFFILTDTWGEDLFGRYVFIFSFFSLGGMVCTLGMDGIIKTEILLLRPAGELGKLKRLMKEHVKLKLLIGVGAVVLMTCAGFFCRSLIEYAHLIFIAAGVYFLVFSFRWLYDSIFHALGQFRLLLCFNFMDAAIRLALILVVVRVLGGSISESAQLALVLCSFPVSVALAELILLPWAIKKLKFLRGVEPEPGPLLKNIILKRGKYAIFVPQIRSLMEQIPIWIIGGLLGTTAVAMFGVAKKGYITLLSIFKAIEGAILPTAIEEIARSWETAKLLLRKSIKYSLVVATGIIVPCCLIAPLVFQLIWQGKYSGAVPLFQLYLFVFFVHAFEVIVIPTLYAFRRQDYFLFAHIIGVVAIAVFFYILASAFSLPGMMMALIFGRIFYVGASYYFIRKCKPDFKLNIADFFSFDDYDRRLLNKALGRFRRKTSE
jgi:O-antigen/teichoic acid export membrane protein